MTEVIDELLAHPMRSLAEAVVLVLLIAALVAAMVVGWAVMPSA